MDARNEQIIAAMRRDLQRICAKLGEELQSEGTDAVPDGGAVTTLYAQPCQQGNDPTRERFVGSGDADGAFTYTAVDTKEEARNAGGFGAIGDIICGDDDDADAEAGVAAEAAGEPASFVVGHTGLIVLVDTGRAKAEWHVASEAVMRGVARMLLEDTIALENDHTLVHCGTRATHLKLCIRLAGNCDSMPLRVFARQPRE